MIAAIYALFLANCFFLCLIVLIQSGKGGGVELLGGGGGGSATLFGNRGATTFIHKMTIGSAALFMTLSMLLAYLSTSPATVDPGAFRAAPAAPATGAPPAGGMPGIELDFPGGMPLDLDFGDESPGGAAPLEESAPTGAPAAPVDDSPAGEEGE